MAIEYMGLNNIQGPLAVIEGVDDTFYEEMVTVTLDNGEKRIGRVIEISGDKAVIQVFEGTSNLSLTNTKTKFMGEPMRLPLSKEMLGRTLDGIGRPIDGLGDYFADEVRDVNGQPINPVSREYPNNFIQTGISSIDCLATLIRGQKLPIFSGAGLPHNNVAAQIARQARVLGTNDKFAVVFAAMGITFEEAQFFIDDFTETGAIDRAVLFMNLADDPAIERLATPKMALTCAEYLAFEMGMHVLVIMTDITSYGEALREVSSSREEVPSRKGYPGHLYSDLAMLYERAGMIKGIDGSVTLIPILTMPNDDITHPIPDLTGYITEGQIVLSRDLHGSGIYPPINVLPSLSRLMKDGIGEGYTREDHADLSSQLFASYSKVQEVRALSQIIGREDLSDSDKKILDFGDEFEKRFLRQRFDENRTIEETLDLGWELLEKLPEESLDRIDPELKKRYLNRKVEDKKETHEELDTQSKDNK